jgi:aspartate/methionine/tyrosine aminotransferase
MEFSASKEIHLISDEIYALSTYEREDRPSEKFTSVRSIDPSGIIDSRQVHVLYGMSKVSGGVSLVQS